MHAALDDWTLVLYDCLPGILWAVDIWSWLPTLAALQRSSEAGQILRFYADEAAAWAINVPY